MFNKIAIQFFRYTVLLVIKVDVGLFRFKHFFNMMTRRQTEKRISTELNVNDAKNAKNTLLNKRVCCTKSNGINSNETKCSLLSLGVS